MEAIPWLLLPVAGGLAAAAAVLAALVVARLRALEQRLQRLETRTTAQAATSGAREPASATIPSSSVPAASSVPGSQPEGEPRPATVAAVPPVPPPSPAPVGSPAPLSGPAAPSAAAGPGWEERLGARLPVWLGAIALALAAAFLVKYTVDHDLLSPPVRVALGLVLGAGLLAGGERLRRSVARVADGLSAAGVAAVYASLLAAVNLYELISPGVGFALLALNTAVAIGLTLRHGVLVAAVGLVGGFTLPIWVAVAEPNLWGLFGYLFLLQGAVLAVGRQRGWPGLAALALGAGGVWAFTCTLAPPEEGPWEWPVLLFALLTVSLVAGTSGVRSGEGRWGGLGVDLGLVRGALAGGLLLTGAVTLQAHFGPREWAFVGLLAAAGMVLGRLQPRLHGLAWLGGLTPAALLAAWRLNAGWTAEEALPGFLPVAAAFGGLVTGGAYAGLWRSPQAGGWAALCATAAVAYFLLSFWGGGGELPWGALALAAAALLAAAAVPVARRREGGAAMERSLAGLVVGVTVLASFAAPLELRREWLTVAWAIEVPVLVWLAGRFRLPVLHWLSWALGGLVAVRLLLNPSVLGYPVGETPIVNWLLYGYGVPAAAFTVAAFLGRRQGVGVASRVFEWGAFALGTALVLLQVRHVHHGSAFGTADPLLVEAGTATVVLLALACTLALAARRWPLPSLVWGAPILALATLAGAVVLQLVELNPLLHATPVGERAVVNTLGWAYGLPALLLVPAGRLMAGRPGLGWARGLFGAAGLVFAFAFLSLEVRRSFRGAILTDGTAGGAEHYAYSAVWMLLAVALLVYGVWRRRRPVRLAGLVVMSIVVFKVFLFDMANLVDLYRVASFLGLGASLMLLAYLYNRFVFRPKAG